MTKYHEYDTYCIEMKPGEKIKALREQKGWSRKKLADHAGLHQDTVSKVERGERRKLETLEKLAISLGSSLDYLFSDETATAQFEPIDAASLIGVAESSELYVLGEGREIPVLGWVEAGEFAPSGDKDFAAGVADEYIYSNLTGDHLFALKVRGDSMEPEFHEGQCIMVNPDVEARSGDYVIAKLDWEDAATFKQIFVSSSEIKLKPLNPEYNTITLTEDDNFRIVGKVVEVKTFFGDKSSHKGKNLAEVVALLSKLNDGDLSKLKSLLEWIVESKG